MTKAKEIAAQCWCDEKTKSIEMDTRLAEAFEKRIIFLLEKINQLERSEESAWGLIANAYGSDWNLASDEWKQAAEKWRDNYLSSL